MVPGLDVARIDSNEWAVSSRGFNDQYASKLLVMIDGRTIYTPSSGGVYWNAQDMMLEDVDRIEVIRGPGATLWGANAVNGVINIITKAARDTQGTLISTSIGTEDEPSFGMRYGDQLGSNVQYRTYLKYLNRESFSDAAGNDARDSQRSARGGARLDWQSGAKDNGTLQADVYYTDAHNPITSASFEPPYTDSEDEVAQNRGADILGSLTHFFSSTSQITIQSYFQHYQQGRGDGVEYLDSYDLEVQHHVALGQRNDVVWGLGYRHTTVRNAPTSSLVWRPETVGQRLFQTFVQDEITLVPERWRLMLGSKLEHNDLTGLEVEPSARLLWTPVEGDTLWAAFSRATRTPSLFDRSSQLTAAVFQPSSGPPVWVQLLGNPHADEEKLLAYELGYRFQPVRTLSFDVAGFYNVYHDLLTSVNNEPVYEVSPSPAHILVSSTTQNAERAQTYGVEISAQWQALPCWRIAGSYTSLRIHTWPDDPSTQDASPRQQSQLRSYLDLPGHVEVNGAVAYVDPITVIPTVAPVGIPAYLRFDLGASWRPSDALEVGLWGQNLLRSRHLEFPSAQTPLQIEIPRSVQAHLTWRF
jgi:iron complex outermembrane receptor protein